MVLIGPWQAFGQEYSSSLPEESSTGLSAPVSPEQDSESSSTPPEQDSEKASTEQSDLHSVTEVEETLAPEENVNDTEADELTDTSTEASTLGEDAFSQGKAENTSSPVLETDELNAEDNTSAQEEEITPLAVYSGTCGANLNWAFDTDTGVLAITGSGAMTNFSPNGNPWYAYRANITSIELPNGLTSIGVDAFDDCTAFTSVTIPDSVTSIGSYAFDGCDALVSITFPSSVTSIGDGVFDSCTSLVSATIPNSVTSLGTDVFYYCTALSSVTIPNSLTNLGDYVFFGCISLTSVTIPSSVANIGYNAFSYCQTLNKVVFQSSTAPTVDATAFDGAFNTGVIYYPVGASSYTVAWKNAIAGDPDGTLTGYVFTGLINWTFQDYVEPVLQADTDALIFAAQTVGSSSDAQTITISGTGLTPDISCILSGSGVGAFILDTATLSAAGGTLSVTFAPTAAGSHSATLTLSSQGITGGVATVITLSGTASAAPSTDPPSTDPTDPPSTEPPAQDNTTDDLPQTSDNSIGLGPFIALIASGSALALLGLVAWRRKTA